jgi:glutamate 5-kinase
LTEPEQPLFRKELKDVRTVVVKTGSRILTAAGHETRVEQLASDMSALRKSGIRVVLVSSGAIAHGMRALGLDKRPAEIPMQQACAAIGQNRLMAIYREYFAEHGTLTGQVLLTWDDLRGKKRYLNLRNTLFKLLDCGAIPIVNENDSVSVDEICFGNNDTLAAQMAMLVNADVLVNLTDVGGLYDKNPHTEKDAKHIPVVNAVVAGFHKMVSEKKSEISVGGMSTKLKAAEMVTRAGIPALIGDGFNRRLLTVLNDESSATLFLPSDKKIPSRRRWIAFTGQSAGSVAVDAGASKAITERGKSLLAAGITRVNGKFNAGDMVDIVDSRGGVIAKGLVNFSADEVEAIRGSKTADVEKKLGAVRFNEVILRDNMVVG